jgi:hypothetical protein
MKFIIGLLLVDLVYRWIKYGFYEIKSIVSWFRRKPQ